MSNCHFVPAGIQLPIRIGNVSKELFQNGWISPSTGKKIKFTFWNDDDPYKYDYALLSAAYAMGHATIKTRKDNNIPDNIKIVGDSGGFQILTGEMKGKKVDLPAAKC